MRPLLSLRFFCIGIFLVFNSASCWGLDFRRVSCFGISARSSRSEISLRLLTSGFHLAGHSISRSGVETHEYRRQGHSLVLKSYAGEILEMEASQLFYGRQVLNRGDSLPLVSRELGKPTRVVTRTRGKGNQIWVYEDQATCINLGVLFQDGKVVRFRMNQV